MNRTTMTALAASVLLLVPAAPGHTQHQSHDHGAHQMDASQGDDSASSRAFAEVNERMHEAMDIEFTGDADIDFVRGMIAHHIGAIEMARVVIEHGEDQDIRALAEEIIEAQETEVEMMEAWLEENAR